MINETGVYGNSVRGGGKNLRGSASLIGKVLCIWEQWFGLVGWEDCLGTKD